MNSTNAFRYELVIRWPGNPDFNQVEPIAETQVIRREVSVSDATELTALIDLVLTNSAAPTTRLRVERFSEARYFAGFEAGVEHQKKANPSPKAKQYRDALKMVADALDHYWAAIGDRLCGDAPLSKEYAQSVASKVHEARRAAEAVLR